MTADNKGGLGWSMYRDDQWSGTASGSDKSTASESVELTVDGHDFRVQARAGEPGVYDFDWLTGPHSYGFTSARSDRDAMSRDELEEAIRGFLAQINPATGYID